MKLLITGNCGFIGQNFVRLYKGQHELVGIDCLSYASDIKAESLIKTYFANLKDSGAMEWAMHQIGEVDGCIHFAAESHVDNSINSPSPFMQNNILSTINILEYFRKSPKRVLVISTDEVYGQLTIDEPAFNNDHLLKPSSPYSASKTASDLIAMSYYHTYNMDVLLTRSTNNYGPYQYKEKFIPVVINSILNNKQIPVYGRKK
jgi:dTDP-glucose 4,6-dehydratase